MQEKRGNLMGREARTDRLLDLSEQDLRDIFASTYELLAIARRGGMEEFNSGWERVLGYTRDELRSLRLIDLIHPVDRSAAQAALQALRLRGEPCVLESRYRHRDGSTRWLHWIGQQLSTQDRICVFGHDITTRKLSEQAAQENQRRLYMATKAAGVGVWEIDLPMYSSYFSPGWQTVLGYEEGELELDFETWARLCHPGDLAGLRQRVDWVIANPGADSFEVEYRMRAKDGSWRWILGRGTVVARGPSGQALRLCGTSIDITDRKRVEAELQRLVTIVDESPLLVSTSTATTLGSRERVTYLNTSGKKLLGLQEDCVTKGMKIQDVHPVWAQRIVDEQGIPAACEHGFWQGETAVIDITGREIPVQQFIVAHQGRGGGIEYFSTIMRDLTEQKRSEQALRESEQRFRTLFESVPYAVVIQDLEGRFVDVNPHYLEINGGNSRESLIGRSLEEIPWLFAPEITDVRKEELIRQLMEKGTVGAEVVCHRKTDGRRRNVLFNSRLVTLDGQTRILSAVLDVTELRLLERQVRQSQKMEAIGRLAGGVAHDFNNLLTVIRGYTDLALREIKEGQPLRASLNEVNRAAERASQLTRQLLTFSRSEAVAPVPVDLSAVVSETERMLRRMIGESIPIGTELDPSLPSVMGDSGQISQVLMNLVVNARDAMPGGGRIDIATYELNLDDNSARTFALSSGRYACLRVRDTGKGMEDETLSRIFEPFFTTKAAGQGTGLGLSIIYSIVKQCGGGIRVESAPGAGSCFEVALPLAKAAASPAPVTATEEISGGGGTILLVEDDPALRLLTQKILSGAGYEVLAASEGEGALKLFHKHASEVTILLTDLTLHGMDGRTLSRQLAAANPSLTIVYMSGYSSDRHFDEQVFGECDVFIRKPFPPATLLKMLRRATQKRLRHAS